jgi:hypothetical protein
MLALAAALYSVQVLAAPERRSVVLSAREYQLSIPFRPAQTVALAPNGAAAFVANGGGSDTSHEVIVVYRANGMRVAVTLPQDNLLHQRFPVYVRGPHSERTYPGKRFENIVLADDGSLFATIGFDFSGGYSGIEEYPFVWDGLAWRQALTSTVPVGVSNISVAAVETVSTATYVSDYLNDGPSEIVQQQEMRNYHEDDILVARGANKAIIGHGVATAMRKQLVVGYEVDSQRRWSLGAQPTALAWKGLRTRVALGTGIAWAVNARHEIVGDDRTTVGRPGHPLIWSKGHRIRLSNASGAAYGISDDGTVVGDIDAGAFVSFPDAPRTIRRLDELVHGWHIRHAYAISSNGRILCLATDRRNRVQMIMLNPVERVGLVASSKQGKGRHRTNGIIPQERF